MARSITFKFGADTSQLTRALGGIRKSISGMLGGFSVGGILGAGVAGFGIQQLIGGAMNLNPKVANSLLGAEEAAVSGIARGLGKLEPQILQLTEALPRLIEGVATVIGGLSDFYFGLQNDFEKVAGFAGAGFQYAVQGDITNAADQAARAFTTVAQDMGIIDLDPAVLKALTEGDARRNLGGMAVRAAGASARTQADPARTAEPRP